MSLKEKQKRQDKVVSARRRAEQHEEESGKSSLRLPEGLSMFEPKKGSYRLDIIPYRLKTPEHNPFARGAHLEEGDLYFERTYHIHWVPVAGGKSAPYCCLSKNWGETCPVCDYRAKEARNPDGDEKLIKALQPKERQLWLVYDHSDADKGVQLWDISYHNFGKLLDTKIKNADEDDNYDTFADPKQGMTLKVVLDEASMGSGKPYLQAADIEFKPRKTAINGELLDHGYDLDAIPKHVKTEDLKKVFLQVPEEDEEEDEDEEERPAKKPAKKPSDDEDDENEEEEEGPSFSLGDTVSFEYRGKMHTGEIKAINQKKGVMEIVCEDRERPYVVELDDESLKPAENEEPEDEDEEEEEEAPKKSSKKPEAKKPGRKPSKDDDEDEEEEEESEDDEEWEDEDD